MLSKSCVDWGVNYNTLAMKAIQSDAKAKVQLDDTVLALEEVVSTFMKVAAIGALLILTDCPIIGLGVLAFIGLNIYKAVNTKSEIYEAINTASEGAIRTISQNARRLEQETQNLKQQTAAFAKEVEHLNKEVKARRDCNEMYVHSCSSLEETIKHASAILVKIEESFQK